jgi:hypothetical protein
MKYAIGFVAGAVSALVGLYLLLMRVTRKSK